MTPCVTIVILLVGFVAGSAAGALPQSSIKIKLQGISCPDQIPGCAANRCINRMLNGEETHVCLRCQTGYTLVKHGKSIVQCVPSSISKALSGVSCPAQIPGCAANRCTTRIINGQETPVCLRCQAGYVAVKDGKSTVQCVAYTTSSISEALSGVSCPAQIPGCAAKRCTTRMINGQETPVCLRCQAGYVAVKDGKSTVQCVSVELHAASSSVVSNATAHTVQQVRVRQPQVARTIAQLVLTAVTSL